MKKVIFALVLGFSLSGVAFACEDNNCKTQPLPPVVAGDGGGCPGCDLYPETPVVPSLKDAKMVANNCPGCD